MALTDFPDIITGEVLGTNGDDTFNSADSFAFFGLGGDDNFTVPLDAGNSGPVAIGGAGNDTYQALSNAVAIIADAGGGDDRAISTGISPNRPNSHAGTIDGGQHLLLFDDDSGQEMIVLNWLDPAWMIETYTDADGINYTTAQVQQFVDTSDVGDVSWEQASEGDFTTTEVRDAISQLTARSAELTAAANGGGDTLVGTAALDTLVGTVNNDFISASDGNDSAWGIPGDDLLNGEGGNDRLFGNAGFDTLVGGDGDDTLKGQFNDDQLLGGAGQDVLFGGADTDTLEGSTGNDTLGGNSGNDSIVGGEGDDLVRGQGGADTIFGGNGDDRVLGMQGFDQLFGGDGNDQITGGAADDTMTGGDGVDIFVFGAFQGANVITDFTDGTDKISMVGVPDFATLNIVDTPDGALVTFEDTPTTAITLNGIIAGQLSAADFFFG